MDVRDVWEAQRAKGLSVERVTAAVIDELSDYREDPEDGPDFWFALASLQLQADSLDPAVANEAVSRIPASIEGWIRKEASAADLTEREQVLIKLRRELTLN